MKRMRSLLMSLFAMVLVLALAPALVSAQTGLLGQVKARGTLKLCVADSPYLKKDPATGDWTGYDADLAHAYAQSIGVKVEWVDSSWGNIIPTVQAGKCDIAWGAFFKLPERAKVVDYTVTTHNTGLLVIVRKDDKRFQSYQDLAKPGLTFAQLPEPPIIAQAKKLSPHATIKIIQSDNVMAPALEVVAGRADANVTDALLCYDLVKKNSAARILNGPVIAKTDMGFILRKGNKDLLDSVNAFLTEQTNNGTMAKLGAKYGIPPGFK